MVGAHPVIYTDNNSDQLFLAPLDGANSLHHPPLISYTEFYNMALDHTDLMAEYYAWQSPQGHATM